MDQPDSETRWACVNLPELPLQILVRAHPDWHKLPVAVVESDKPQAFILAVNESARRNRIIPGMRYAAGLSQSRELRAGPVGRPEIETAVKLVGGELRRFSPEVEPSDDEPGILWLNATGLEPVTPSLPKWAWSILDTLRAKGFRSNVAVGFSRFGSYAAAKTRPGVTVFPSLKDETAVAGSAQLDRLGLAPKLLSHLAKLGVVTVRDFLGLPPTGLLERFGPEAQRFHRMATGEAWKPLAPESPVEAPRSLLLLDHPETDSTRLLFFIRRQLHPLLSELAARYQALSELRVRFALERKLTWREAVRPAFPTLDSVAILDLVRLTLERTPLQAPVRELELTAIGTPAEQEQLRLFNENPRRDLRAAARAFARLRAEYGENAVSRVVLRDGHLPDGRYSLEPLQALPLPKDLPEADPALIRRIYDKPVALPVLPGRELSRNLLRAFIDGAIARTAGPFLFEGGWWHRDTDREYHLVETVNGEIVWVFYDRKQSRWFLHGEVR
ncbi:MAG: DNA polymerase Y family protein [Deltaproteobacteria bacterium]|nr:DNA polymerase Y family protein [Deltaproteobacteria bacterium]